MTYSLNEIDALCRKAARGAGFDWGHAEDAGKAARWLQSFGFPGAEQLLFCLEQRGAPPDPGDGPRDDWRGDGALCPLLTGACMSDHAALLTDHGVTLRDVNHPILLAPFLASFQRAVRLDWPGAAVIVENGRAEFSGDAKALLSACERRVTCAIPKKAPGAQPATHDRAALAGEIYDRLNTFAQRTYAPATEASRAAGAGAGLTDND